MADYKHFTEYDVEFAQQIAKLHLNKEKNVDKPTKDLRQELKPKAISFDIQLTDGNTDAASNVNQLHRSLPSNCNKTSSATSVKQRKHREGNLRIKQAMRAACDLSRIIENLERKSKEKQRELPFVIPLELEKRNKRWEEFSHLARRTLYTLKREVNLLSVKVSVPLTKLPDNSLRLLASATQSCLRILKGLENFDDEIKEGQKGNFILREAILTGQHILFIMTMSGASMSTKYSPNVKSDKASGETSEDNLTKSFDILTSDMDSRVSELLNPKTIKKKLHTLVHSLKNKNRKVKSQQLKYISPLKDEMDSVEKSRSSYYPVVENLEDGRKIEFVNDSLSPKLRKRKSLIRKRSYHRQRIVSSSALEDSPEDGKYGVSEKMADAVFERILPYINGNDEQEFAGTSHQQHNKSSIEVYVILEAQKKLDELQKRFNILEITTEKHKQFLSKIKSKLSKSSTDPPDPLNLEEVIKKANICMEKCRKSEKTFPYQESSVDVIVDNLLRNETQAAEVATLPKKFDYAGMEDDVQAMKVEFWNLLVEKNVVPPPLNSRDLIESNGYKKINTHFNENDGNGEGRSTYSNENNGNGKRRSIFSNECDDNKERRSSSIIENDGNGERRNTYITKNDDNYEGRGTYIKGDNDKAERRSNNSNEETNTNSNEINENEKKRSTYSNDKDNLEKRSICIGGGDSKVDYSNEEISKVIERVITSNESSPIEDVNSLEQINPLQNIVLVSEENESIKYENEPLSIQNSHPSESYEDDDDDDDKATDVSINFSQMDKIDGSKMEERSAVSIEQSNSNINDASIEQPNSIHNTESSDKEF